MKKLWLILGAVFVFSFVILGWVGTEVFRQAPPIPKQVVATDGTVLIPEEAILDGQNVWQAMGGMQVGSIWGHGSYVAPDWTADYLHRESLFILDKWSMAENGQPFKQANPETEAVLLQRLQTLMRTNTYNEATGKLTIAPVRAEAFEEILKHYSDVFGNGSKDYAIQKGAQTDPDRMRKLVTFFFWTSWASATNRPNDKISYTSNFPSEPLVANVPTSSSIIWTGVSVIFLIAGIGAMVWFYAGWHKDAESRDTPDTDPLIGETITPSQKATVKYFVVVSLLFLLQIVMGIITAHYGVEGGGLYGIPLDQVLPYVVTRSWHTQLGIFWIATAWLAAGLFIAPYICGYEPKFQRLGVNILFGALLVVVLGSMIGQWMSVMHMLPGDLWFWFGHQGYEYVDLGRVWQAGLFIGLLLWLFLIARSAIPALRKDGSRSLVMLYLLTTAAIAIFYAPGLFWGMRSHLTVVEYWRWWVVHLWVEGFFEVFATVVIAFLFAKLRVIEASHAAYAALLSGSIYLSGGIVGTLHHLYFAGTPTVALAFGATFSALEIVPLVFVGYEALENIRHSKKREWLQQYKWVVYFFVAVAFWNLVGAGIFGFMINPPIALYYMQGLNTTAVHAHGALYGVYGTLGLALLLFCMRAMQPERKWNTKLLSFAFWAINIGMLLEILLSLLPIGLLQTYQSVSVGYWSARSPEFMQTELMQTLRWMRMVGDTIRHRCIYVRLVRTKSYVDERREWRADPGDRPGRSCVKIMNDIDTRTDIDLIMRIFYERALADEVIGYIFRDIAKLDLESHLPIIGDFWESLLFGNRVYQKHGRNPMMVHKALHLKEPLTIEHFKRWLKIFEFSVDEEFSGEMADMIKMRANAIAMQFQRNLNAENDRPVTVSKIGAEAPAHQ